MARFAARLLSFLLLQAIVIGIVIAPYRPNPQLFWAGTRVKHDRLASAASPRVIFTGGSNLAFGLSSAIVEEQLRPYAPVNMGLDAGLGLDFLLNEIDATLRPGDIVVLSPEYELFLGLRGGTASSLSRVIEQRPAHVRNLARVDIVTLFDRGLGFFHWVFANARRGLDRQPITGAYSRSTFNAYGDAEWHLDRPSKRGRLTVAMEAYQQTPVDTSTVGVLNRFHARCQARGVAVYLSHPPLPARYATAPSRLIEVEQRVHARLTIPALDRPAEMFFPEEAFYDTEYHLLRGARDTRTRRIVDRLIARGHGLLLTRGR
jgi:hypothetical protein